MWITNAEHAGVFIVHANYDFTKVKDELYLFYAIVSYLCMFECKLLFVLETSWYYSVCS